ncbi:MAG: hypothetical protein M1831_005893 [Alyxoria varia]|nr:MAG: hypothetical protein M1831_005893 [Alyxoria varia]
MRPPPQLRNASLEAFRSAFGLAKPFVLAKGDSASGTNGCRLPATNKWFLPSLQSSMEQNLNVDYLRRYGENRVQVERTTHPSASEPEVVDHFTRNDVPFGVFIELLSKQPEQNVGPMSRFYLAQCPIDSLDPGLQVDLPTPSYVLKVGRGDIYGSSIWLGRAPTFTPLHKDPNPNLLVQLAGRKSVRVFEPHVGLAIFREVDGMLGRSGSSSESMRGEEMMEGKEREALFRAVWENDVFGAGEDFAFEADLGANDGVFIPKGWWHSVRGIGRDTINGSVNWWFR